MTLDTLLSQPLAPVRDDGFSARIVVELRRAEERRRLLLWGAAALALLPPLALALAPMTFQFVMPAMTRAASSPLFACAVGAAVLLWALRPARSRFF
jgi:hypothetical protein